jgi:hypothetical protein
VAQLFSLGGFERMKISDDELLEVLREFRQVYPHWRFGQMVCNIAQWARGPVVSAVYDVEDDEFVKTAREHLRKKKERA